MHLAITLQSKSSHYTRVTRNRKQINRKQTNRKQTNRKQTKPTL